VWPHVFRRNADQPTDRPSNSKKRNRIRLYTHTGKHPRNIWKKKKKKSHKWMCTIRIYKELTGEKDIQMVRSVIFGRRSLDDHFTRSRRSTWGRHFGRGSCVLFFARRRLIRQGEMDMPIRISRFLSVSGSLRRASCLFLSLPSHWSFFNISCL
jgi:hypothetical protein